MQYEVKNAPLPVLICKLDPNESIECQKGAMSWMTPTMQMQTGLGSGAGGLLGALGKMAKSAVTGESIFRNTYTAQGGEGFIMQKFSGNGVVFLEIDGSVCEYTLAAGQSMLIDTGYLAAMEATCSIDIETVKGIGNVLMGGEGLFNTKVTGPGKIWLQTMPANVLADTIKPFIPTGSN